MPDTLIERLRRGEMIYHSESGPVYSGPTALHTQAADALEAAALAAAEAGEPVGREYWMFYDHQIGRWYVGNENPKVICTGAEVIHVREVRAAPASSTTGAEGVARNEAYTREQLARLAFAIHYSSDLCAPQNIAAAVEEIDCCPGCDHVSASGSTCYKFERGEYCPNLLAETLREISAALYGTPGLSSYREAVWGPGAPSCFLPAALSASPPPSRSGVKPLVYLAARYSRAPEMRSIRDELIAAGYSVTSRWIDGGHELTKEGSTQAHESERTRFAIEDRGDLRAANIVISFTEEPRKTTTRGGRHVEFGMAIERGQRVIVIGHRENVFHCLPEVEFFPTWPDARAALEPYPAPLVEGGKRDG